MIKNQIINVKNCPLCGSDNRRIILENPIDNVLGSVDFKSDIVKCGGCGHAYLSNQLSKECIYKAYSGYYTQSESVLNTTKKKLNFENFSPLYSPQSPKIIKLLSIIFFKIPVLGFFLQRAIRFLPLFPGKNVTVLDVGAGNGEFMHRITKCGFSVKGVDVDPKSVQLCQSKGLDVCLGTLIDANYSAAFDYISCSHVLEHVDDPKAYIEYIHKALRDGGQAYISTPNIDSFGFTVLGKSWRGVDFPRHLHFFSKSVIEQLLLSTGFKEVKFVTDIPQSASILRTSIKLKGARFLQFVILFVLGVIVSVIIPEKREVLVVIAKK